MFDLRVLARNVSISVLILQLCLSPFAFPQVSPNDEIPIDESAATALENRAALEAEKGKEWTDFHQQRLELILEFQVRVFEKYETLKAELGEEKVNEMIERGEMTVRQPDLAKAEISFLDKQLFVRVVDEKTGIAYLLLDKDRVDPLSAHLRQIVARQHVEAGEGRRLRDNEGNVVLGFTNKPKRATGRDVIEVWLDTQGQTAHLKDNPKASMLTARYWRDYFYAKFKKPSLNLNDVSLTLFTGVVMQGALTAAFGAAKAHFGGAEMDWYPAVFTALYGGFIGTFYSTYKNWVNSGSSRIRRAFKANAVSALYGYVFTVLSHGQSLGIISLMTPEGREKNASLWANFTMNNYAKDPWNQIPTIKTKLRQYVKPIRIKIFGKQIEWNRSNFMGQMYYLIPWSMNVITLMGGVSTAIPGTQIHVPILQLLSLPFAQYLLMKYVDHTIEKIKDQEHLRPKLEELLILQSQMKETWGMDVREIPGAVANKAKDLYRSVKIAAGKMVGVSQEQASCRSLFLFSNLNH